MENKVLIVVICVLYFYLFDETTNEVVVKISNGELRGYRLKNIYAFESIPYAEPPVGDLRFEPPKPYTRKWTEIRNAKGKSNECMQWSEFKNDDNNHLIGEEDCLYLNVYTPKIVGDELLPVVIYIHGGAFMHGSTKLLDPYFPTKKENFVYVNLNYRLGPLGFISTEDEQIPGNMGLKDQHLAIKWVKQNIKTFKGNPEQIILSGFSAGGASTHYHVISKKSEGLFKAAISHSGCALNPWALIQNPLERTKKLAALVGCPTHSTAIIKDCLKQKDAKDIVMAVEKFFVFLFNPFTVFGPVIEPEKNNKDPFLVENVEFLIKNRKISKIPWLVGYTINEGVYNGAYLLRKNKNGVEFIQQLNDKWEQVAPAMLFFNESVPFAKHSETANYYKQKYLKGLEITKRNYWLLQRMLTNRYFLEGIKKSINLHRNYNEVPVYTYAFDHPAPINLGQIMSERKDIYFGTGHGDDVYLIFVTNFVREPDTFSKVEQIISEKLINMYESFIKNGIPKYGDVLIPKNDPNTNYINILRIKGTEATVESTDFLD